MAEKKRSVDYLKELSNLTKGVCNIFRKQGTFLPEGIGFPSYYRVRGKEIMDIPDGFMLSNIEYPLVNKDSRDLSDAIHYSEKLGRKFFDIGKKEDIEVLSRCFVIKGSTLPIKINYNISSKTKNNKEKTTKQRKRSLYVKKIDLNKIFLGTLYNLALGRSGYNMLFSESSIVEKEVTGPTILEYYQKGNFLRNKKMREELIKLTIISYFLSLDDMDNGDNIILSRGDNFRVIDFDKGFFEEPLSPPNEKILNPFVYKTNHDGVEDLVDVPYKKVEKHFSKREIDAVVKSETEKIYCNIKKRIDLFHQIIEEMANFDYYNLAANELYGEKDVVSYFLKRYHEFKPR